MVRCIFAILLGMAALLPPEAKGRQHRRSLPPCQRSPVPEPCFYPGTKHQWELGLSLPNRIRD